MIRMNEWCLNLIANEPWSTIIYIIGLFINKVVLTPQYPGPLYLGEPVYQNGKNVMCGVKFGDDTTALNSLSVARHSRKHNLKIKGSRWYITMNEWCLLDLICPYSSTFSFCFSGRTFSFTLSWMISSSSSLMLCTRFLLRIFSSLPVHLRVATFLASSPSSPCRWRQQNGHESYKRRVTREVKLQQWVWLLSSSSHCGWRGPGGVYKSHERKRYRKSILETSFSVHDGKFLGHRYSVCYLITPVLLELWVEHDSYRRREVN